MLLDDIGSYLQQQNIGIVGVDIFKGQLPVSPDDVIVLYEYGGEPQDLTDANLEYPSLQVLVRNKSYQAGRQKIEQVKSKLHGLTETTINNVRYLLIQARQNPFLLERDENGRAIFVCNFRIIKEVG